MKKHKYILQDTFNGRDISQHRTIVGAVKAMDAHSRAVERSNGPGHYIPKRIVARNGNDISEEIMAAQENLWFQQR